VGIADSFSIGLVAIGEAVQEIQDIVRCYLIDFGITELLAEPIGDRPI
jgi:hypothetical protein